MLVTAYPSPCNCLVSLRFSPVILSRRPPPINLNSTYHVDADDLTSGLLNLLETTHEVPVTGLGDNGVGRKDTHAVQSRGRVCLGGQMPADDLVLLETT